MNRASLENAISVILTTMRRNGTRTGRLAMVNGRPALAASGVPVLIPADLTDREIAGQCQVFAGQLMGGQHACS